MLLADISQQNKHVQKLEQQVQDLKAELDEKKKILKKISILLSVRATTMKFCSVLIERIVQEGDGGGGEQEG